MFKAGDKVRRLTIGKDIYPGKIYTIEICSRTFLRVVGKKHTYDPTYFELVSKDRDKRSPISSPEALNKWSFQVHSQEDIDRRLVYNSLSRTNPVALIDSSLGSFVIYHESLLVKARVLGLPPTPRVTTREGFPEAIQWAKSVRAMRWHIKAVTVSISTPNI